MARREPRAAFEAARRPLYPGRGRALRIRGVRYASTTRPKSGAMPLGDYHAVTYFAHRLRRSRIGSDKAGAAAGSLTFAGRLTENHQQLVVLFGKLARVHSIPTGRRFFAFDHASLVQQIFRDDRLRPNGMFVGELRE